MQLSDLRIDGCGFEQEQRPLGGAEIHLPETVAAFSTADMVT